jgi:aryl-alcohol dehydrogenase-like predicted oxidoreductase
MGPTAAQTTLRWVMDQPFMTSAIVGARNVEQLGETLKAGGRRLPLEALDRLNKVSSRPWRYPRAFAEPMLERRSSAVKMLGMK